MIPVVGMVFDGTNFIVYSLEGDAFGASMSAVAFVPYVGEVSGAAKISAKTAKYAGEAWKAEEAFVLTSRYADDAAELSYKLLKKEGRYLDDDIVKAVRDIHYSAYADNWWGSMNPICITVLEDNTMILSKNRGKLPKKAIERANEILFDVDNVVFIEGRGKNLDYVRWNLSRKELIDPLKMNHAEARGMQYVLSNNLPKQNIRQATTLPSCESCTAIQELYHIINLTK